MIFIFIYTEKTVLEYQNSLNTFDGVLSYSKYWIRHAMESVSELDDACE